MLLDSRVDFCRMTVSSKQTDKQRRHIMIIQTVNEHDFRQAFIDYNRGEQFSYNGLTALFEWLEELAEDTGTPYELDVIALCCEFTEYENLQEIQANYSSTKLDNIDDLQDHTSVIEFDGGIIIQDF